MLLAFSLLLTACAPSSAAPEPERESAGEEVSASEAPVSVAHGYADELFTVPYDAEAGFDPFGDAAGNAWLYPLLYEGLFRVTESFEAEPVLCESWDTEDGKVFHFRVREDVRFHNGSRLTPEDVAGAVSALSGDDFLYSTGDYIDVDGGFHIRRL